jgi:hypothetical protein
VKPENRDLTPASLGRPPNRPDEALTRSHDAALNLGGPHDQPQGDQPVGLRPVGPHPVGLRPDRARAARDP